MKHDRKRFLDEECEVIMASWPDYEALRRFYNEVGRDEFRPFPQLSRPQLDRLFAWNWTRIVVIRLRADQTIIASVSVSVSQTLEDTAAQVGHLLVDPAWRRQGLGRRAMEELHVQARQLQINRLLHTAEFSSVAAHTLFESMGYQLNKTSSHYFLRLT